MHAFQLTSAAQNGDIDTLEQLRREGHTTLEDYRRCEVLYEAALFGHLDALEWFASQGAATPADCRAKNNAILIDTIFSGRTDILEWLRKQGAATAADCHALRYMPLYSEHISVLQWWHDRMHLRDKAGCVHIVQAACAAAEKNNPAVYNWLMELCDDDMKKEVLRVISKKVKHSCDMQLN